MDKKGTKTLLMSVLMSAPGPLILGIGLIFGQSSTQIADFIRRTIELFAIIASFIAYMITARRQLDEKETARLERYSNLFVGTMMLAAGVIMLCIALLSDGTDGGNVVMSLIVALLGAAANTFFWFRYMRLARLEQSAILEVQSKLYRAKSFVDICVTAALFALLVAPASPLTHYIDMIGSSVVAVYLGYSGVKIIIEKARPGRE